jgi:PHD/YefM family antitoxin component YafN of YafNO toxin-antitoxin module
METVTISKEEYEEMKRESEVDWELVNKIKRSLEDIKHGRIREWKPSK